jgi:alkanesulfonate monooxygenase SsuD/methylene tetrahydromethanopterin reductase-like flavin-dependent oxidoreductase (luciferase family)
LNGAKRLNGLNIGAQRLPRLEFGVLLHTRHLIRAGGPTNFEPLWRDAMFADERGFDHIWLGDSITILDKARGDCLTTMAALAAKTRRIRIGVAPFLAVLRNPVVLAHSLATLDVISGGRIILGASVGSVKDDMNRQFDACGVPHGEKAGRLNECIEIIRRLWTEESVNFAGRYYQLRETAILPRPIQKPGIPMWFATGRNDTALKRTARLGDGWITNAGSLEIFTSSLSVIEAHRPNSTRSGAPYPIALYASVHLDGDGDRARSQGWAWMEDFFRQPRAKLSHHLAIFGTPGECAEILRGYIEAGLTAIICRFASEDQHTQMHRCLHELKPRVT